MPEILLSIHVIAVILALGPVAVAGSMFPGAARAVQSAPNDQAATSTILLLHRICRIYSVVGLVIPIAGLTLAIELKVLTNAWLLISIALAAVAAAVLIFLILPAQRAIVAQIAAIPDAIDGTAAAAAATGARRLAMWMGIFNLLWVTIAVLMVTHPGSTAP